MIFWPFSCKLKDNHARVFSGREKPAKCATYGIKIAKNNDKEILDMLANKNSGVILYTCDRQEGISLTDKRHYLIAEKTSGPLIK